MEISSSAARGRHARRSGVGAALEMRRTDAHPINETYGPSASTVHCSRLFIEHPVVFRGLLWSSGMEYEHEPLTAANMKAFRKHDLSDI